MKTNNPNDVLSHKIDFIILLNVHHANPNGDPLNGNRPRTDTGGYGEISAECIRRKIRNRLQDAGEAIFVQSQERSTDGFRSLHERVIETLGKNLTPSELASKATETWLDVRAFGQVFAFKGESASIGVKGPVTVHPAVSVSPVDIRTYQISKSVNNETTDKEGQKSSDTLGQKHFVQFGLYVIKGAINVQTAEKTGFTNGDAEAVKEALRTLCENDASSARPEGSMSVERLYWFEHDCKLGQYSSAAVHRSVKIVPKDPSRVPSSIDDYEITLEHLEGLAVEEFTGR